MMSTHPSLRILYISSSLSALQPPRAAQGTPLESGRASRGICQIPEIWRNFRSLLWTILSRGVGTTLCTCIINCLYIYEFTGDVARPYVGQDMLTLSGTPDVTPFGEFIISPIRYILITGFVSLVNIFKNK